LRLKIYPDKIPPNARTALQQEGLGRNAFGEANRLLGLIFGLIIAAFDGTTR